MSDDSKTLESVRNGQAECLTHKLKNKETWSPTIWVSNFKQDHGNLSDIFDTKTTGKHVLPW